MTGQNGNTAVLEVRKLVKRFGAFTAVDALSFAIEPGICFGLLGPNGAGKTTTIEIIEGLLSPDSGDILYKGQKRDSRFYEEIGIQFQNTELPHQLTVRETLFTFRSLYRRKRSMDDLIRLCRLEDIEDRDNRKISGGQKQRLLLAMAMANDPDLVFLDEPTTGLDPQARRHLWDIVFQMKAANKTIVLTTHYMEEAQILCDRIAIMDQGRFIAEGSPAGLLNDHVRGASVILPGPLPGGALTDFPFPWFLTRENQVEIQTLDINGCLGELVRRDVDLAGITVRPQNLEDLFLKLTGHGLRD